MTENCRCNLNEKSPIIVIKSRYMLNIPANKINRRDRIQANEALLYCVQILVFFTGTYCNDIYIYRDFEKAIRLQENSSDCLHTYTIGHYNPSVWIINLVSHTTYVVCVFWETFFMEILFILLPEICWTEIAKEIYFVFCFDVWPGARTLV